ncbi:glutathione transferase GstA [Azonexus sp.]|jgi:glutathione S-transferase|uniref:glutathione transferase GstA n=1 Tax=Azonexus sp. TaxID=1872668 RepID=UPI00282FF040|nr:glutathione transferase GstA [Azonexus sp.]MDR1996538.1 glutathione transferase GstA [Azonexus sp.]
MKLYYVPGACSLSPHIVLRESGLPFESVQVDAKSHELPDGTDYYTINPLGYVPLLELGDGTHLREGPVIVQYIADQVPQRNLAPANGTLARYHLQEWLNFIGTELHKGFGPLFNPATPDAYKAVTKERLAARLKWVDGQLAGKNYLMGENFSVADAYLFTVTNWIEPVGGMDISNLSNINAFRARVSARPAVREAMKAEGLLN